MQEELELPGKSRTASQLNGPESPALSEGESRATVIERASLENMALPNKGAFNGEFAETTAMTELSGALIA